jgi:predicted GNAT family N-acyltransferase
MDYSVRFASSQSDLDAAFQLRRHVFEVEQKIPRPLYPDTFDGLADHAVAYDASGRCIATGRAFRLDSRTVRIGRQVVAPDVRHNGVGRSVYEALERITRMRGMREIVVHAHLHAEPFYLRIGFEREGEIFEEKDVRRVRLRKRIELRPTPQPPEPRPGLVPRPSAPQP